jgi:nucleotide-binding universal stress UspA family protein
LAQLLLMPSVRREFLMFDTYPPKCVVVGIDGSSAAARAARWAVHEVAGTDIPLRLLYVAKAIPNATAIDARAALAAADEIVHDACRAVGEMGIPLKIEADIIHGEPVRELIAASRSTPLLCVGDTGPAQQSDAWIGSTAKELALSAHCSVAVIRGSNTAVKGGGCIVARVDETPDDFDVLDLAINEALRRHASLRVVTAPPSPTEDIRADRKGCLALDHFLKRLADDYPDVEIDTVTLQGSFLDYLAAHAASIQLVMLSAARAGEVRDLVGAPGARALQGSDVSLLVVGVERPGR